MMSENERYAELIGHDFGIVTEPHQEAVKLTFVAEDPAYGDVVTVHDNLITGTPVGVRELLSGFLRVLEEAAPGSTELNPGVQGTRGAHA